MQVLRTLGSGSAGRNDAHMNTYHTIKPISEGYGTAEGRAVVVRRLSVSLNSDWLNQGLFIGSCQLPVQPVWLWGSQELSGVSLHAPLIFASLGVLDWFFLCQQALSKWQWGEVGVGDGKDMTVDIPKTNCLQLRVGESH